MTGYKGGHIVRIKVKDFMTYDDLEIFPKKGLNIIIGLNGSGKSSLMSAICLGLAGRPQNTGKSNQLVDFIKHGKEKAMIEIELDDPIKNVVIRHLIVGDKSTWFLNNSSVSRNEILSTVSKYNIDVGNLCQFLPQEKVSDFSKMDHKQRLEIMIQAIGEPTLHTRFKDLKKMRLDFCFLQKMLSKFENNHSSEIKLNERIKVDVDKHEERALLQLEIETFQLQKKVIEYKICEVNLKEVKKEKEVLKISVKEIKGELKTMQSNLAAISSSLNEKLLDIRTSAVESAHNSDKLSKHQSKLSELHEKVDAAKIEYRNRIDEKRNQKAKLVDLQHQIQALKQYYENSSSTKEDIKQKMVKNAVEHERVKRERETTDTALENIKLQINQMHYENENALAEITQLKNVQNCQMNFLRQRFRGTYDAVCWLEQNKSSFKSMICLPPLICVTVFMHENCKYIENMIPFKDLRMFICTDKEDLARLIDILNTQKRLGVNVAMAPQNPRDYYKPKTLTPHHRKMGIECFVSELFTAPDPVFCYLCDVYRLHKVPVCNANGERQTENILKEFSMFYTPDERVISTHSRYGRGNQLIRKIHICGKNLFQTAANAVNSNRIRELEAKRNHNLLRMTSLTSQGKTSETQRNELEKDQEQLRKERNVLDDNLFKIESVERQLQGKIMLYDKKKSEVIDEKAEKERLISKILAINTQRKQIMSVMKTLGFGFVKLKLENTTNILYAKTLSKKLSVLRTATEKKKSSFENLERNLNAKQIESAEIRRKAQELYTYITENKLATRELLDTHQNTLEEIEQKIFKYQALLDLNSEDNDAIVAQYKSRQQKILNINNDIKDTQTKLSCLEAEINEKKKQWLPVLQSHITTINKKFSKYYKLLKCAGEISLEVGNDPNDFTEYGLQIKLKYRDNEPFCVLSPDHHSGGERNVASVIFILSLQELTTVPFRCVDEINQGMDSSNERKMYEFIADDAAKTGSCSQYFLLTPKLLKNLAYQGNVAVHIIFNSKYLNTKLNIKEHLEIASMN